MSDLRYWTVEKVAALDKRKEEMFGAFCRDYPGVIGVLLCRGLQSVYWNDGFAAAEKAMDQIGAAEAAPKSAEVADLESRLNDAYYERDCLRNEVQSLRSALSELSSRLKTNLGVSSSFDSLNAMGETLSFQQSLRILFELTNGEFGEDFEGGAQ